MSARPAARLSAPYLALALSAFPGGGAAAPAIQIATQELNRAVSYAGQVAAIGVEGVQESLKVTGSGVGQDSSTTIPGRILQGVAGVRPTGKNTAGNTAGSGKGAQGSPGDQQSQPDPSSGGGGMNIGVMNVHAQDPNAAVRQVNAEGQMAIGGYGNGGAPGTANGMR